MPARVTTLDSPYFILEIQRACDEFRMHCGIHTRLIEIRMATQDYYRLIEETRGDHGEASRGIQSMVYMYDSDEVTIVQDFHMEEGSIITYGRRREQGQTYNTAQMTKMEPIEDLTWVQMGGL